MVVNGHQILLAEIGRIIHVHKGLLTSVEYSRFTHDSTQSEQMKLVT